jgi:hypothetical protein
VGIVAEGSDGKRFECTVEWENLLNTLRDLTAFDRCPCVENCGTGGTGGSGGSGTGGSCGTGPAVINYVGWEYTGAGGCSGIGDTELTVTISACGAGPLTYSGTVSSCQTPISMMSQTLTDCFSGSIEFVDVTVQNTEGTDSISAQWESAICEEGCEENDEVPEPEGCPSPWPPQ